MKMNPAASLSLRLSFPVICFLILLQISPPARAGEALRLTSPAGKSIEVELISIDHEKDTVQFRRLSDQRIFTSKITIFDALTQLKLRLRKVQNEAPAGELNQLLAGSDPAQKNPDDTRRPGF